MVGSLWGDNEGEMCIYTGMLDGLTIMLENDLKQFWHSHAVTLQMVSSQSYDSLHANSCFSLSKWLNVHCEFYMIIFAQVCDSIFFASDAARKKMKTYLKMGQVKLHVRIDLAESFLGLQ